MTWGEFKAKVKAEGVNDDSVIEAIRYAGEPGVEVANCGMAKTYPPKKDPNGGGLIRSPGIEIVEISGRLRA